MQCDFFSLAHSLGWHHGISCRPLPDALRPLAARVAGSVPADAVEAAREVAETAATGGVGGGMGAGTGPLGLAGMVAQVVAMNNWPPLEEEAEIGVEVHGVPGTWPGTYAAGGPVAAAPITLSGVGPKICARFAAHRRVTSSSGTMRGSMPGTGGYTRPGIRCTPGPLLAVPRPPPVALCPKIVAIAGSLVATTCRSTCSAAVDRACNAGEPIEAIPEPPLVTTLVVLCTGGVVAVAALAGTATGVDPRVQVTSCAGHCSAL